MSQTNVPAQPGDSDRTSFDKGTATPPPPPGAPPPASVPPAASEATRLLCAGTYLDGGYRDAVIEELYLHEERFAAPSLGIDAARVLAHALRARRTELGWAAALVGLWLASVPLSYGLTLFYAWPVLLLGLSRLVRRLPLPYWLAAGAAFMFRWYGRLCGAVIVVFVVAGVFGATASLVEWVLPWSSGSSYSTFGYEGAETSGWTDSGAFDDGSSSGSGVFALWVTLALPFAVTALVALQRRRTARVLQEELSRTRFPDLHRDPAEAHTGERFQRLRERIRTEQHGQLVMYRPGDPFRGAGEAYGTWSLSVELRPRKDAEVRPLDNAAFLERIVPLVEALRVPSVHRTPQARAAVRDRLRELETDECVFLPADGIPARALAPYAPAELARHRAEAVEEGGETRRHFLRIRIGGWHEGVVTTVFVRVHTQGGMLMLEVAPHVLWPVRQQFQDADRFAHQEAHLHPVVRALRALIDTPRAGGRAVVTLARGLRSVWRLATGGHAAALPEGPGLAVRELGSYGEASLFQGMDAARYLKTVQQRVTAGVTTTLREAGYVTEEFEQRVVNVAEGGVYIESAQGAVGIGDHNTVTHNDRRGGAPTEGATRGNH
ncbi:hypothetical protein [Streptomyces catenulae]|uniref:Integral membrane protein n=1 Tax=Streptomyces catenulae TaxID=66875 RepID=A0ABV2YU36_9ACTN|nr:hypothetical protein [Streptomyces catenulae]